MEPKLARFVARLVARLGQLPAVQAAYVGQLFFPTTEQLTTPVLGLVLDGALAPGAFAPLGSDDPLVIMVIGDDAVSRLLRAGSPVYTREDPPAFYVDSHYK